MKAVSKIVLAIALGAAMGSSSAYAFEDKPKAEKKVKKDKKGKEEAAVAKKNFSKEFTKAYAPAVDAFNTKKDMAASKAAIPTLIAAIMNEDDRNEAGVYAFAVGRATSDTALQLQGIDLILQSTSTPAELRPPYHFQKGLIAYNAKDYPTAQNSFVEAYNLGYRDNSAAIQISNTFSLQNNTAEALNWLKRGIEDTIAKGQTPEKQWFARAANFANKLKDKQAIVYWGKELVKFDPRKESYHDAIFNYIVYADLDNLEALSLLRLARKTDAILFEHEYRSYVESADLKRYPVEVLAVLGEGFAKKVISENNLTFSEFKKQAEARRVEMGTNWDADEKAALASAKGYQALLQGDIILSTGDFARAKKLYEAALAKGGLIDKEGLDQTDRALTNMAIAQYNLNDLAGAKATFAKITTPKRKGVADYWMIYIDQQLAKPVA
ncbi:MAG: hypothetical protein IPN50_04720 [Sphingomonadales bacterium]|nr:hypothetical protein [Sphingomonadales bacterium]